MSRKNIFAIVVGLVSVFIHLVPAVRADEPPGAKLYATYCVSCHGAGGKGGFAPVIGDEKYLSSRTDDVITKITSEGTAGKGMPAWSKAKGGTLSDTQISDIVAYLRSLSVTAAPVAIPTPAPVALTATDYVQTRMTMEQSLSTNGLLIVNATLKDFNGNPVVGASIGFVHTATFGKIELGAVKTDSSGIASLSLTNLPETARQVDASYKGDRSFGSSAGRIVVRPQRVASSSGEINLNNVRLAIGDEPLLAPEGSLITPNPPLVPTLLFGLVVLGVWSAYGYVVLQVVEILKSKPSTRRENTLTTKPR